MVDVLNTVGLQWATLGNHEFDIPESALKSRLSEGRFTVVISNVTDAAGALFPGTVRTAVVPVTANGRTIRLGLLGVVTDDLKQPWVKYDAPLAAAKAAATDLAGRVDALVALTHLELEDDARMAEAIPELDLILGGHDHDNWLVRRGARFTPIVKADVPLRSSSCASPPADGPPSKADCSPWTTPSCPTQIRKPWSGSGPQPPSTRSGETALRQRLPSSRCLKRSMGARPPCVIAPAH